MQNIEEICSKLKVKPYIFVHYYINRYWDAFKKDDKQTGDLTDEIQKNIFLDVIINF